MEVIQSDNAIVQTPLTEGVVLEHQAANHKDMMNLVIDLGTPDEIGFKIDNDPDKFQKVMDLYHSNATKEDYINAFK